jgi:hypothetical protein
MSGGCPGTKHIFFFVPNTFFSPQTVFAAPRPGAQKYSDGLKNLLCRKVKVMFREVEIIRISQIALVTHPGCPLQARFTHSFTPAALYVL